jgi:hypothetical protein
MWETGQKTKNYNFWMTESDAAHFSELLSQMQPELVWETSPPSPNHLNGRSFKTLTDALTYGASAYARWAHARLALGAVFFHLSVQKFNTADYKGYFPKNYAYPSDGTIVDHGWLAARWNTMDGDEYQQALVAKQVKAIFSVLTKATLPAKAHFIAGHSVSGFRIGAQMLAQVRANQWFLKTHGPIAKLA